MLRKQKIASSVRNKAWHIFITLGTACEPREISEMPIIRYAFAEPFTSTLVSRIKNCVRTFDS